MSITLRGASRTYELDCGSTNAICRIEAACGQPYRAVLKELRSNRPKPVIVRGFIRGALVDGPTAPTTEVLRAVVKDIGGVKVISKAARAAAKASQA